MAKTEPLLWDALLLHVRTARPDLYRAWFEELPAGELLGGELRVRVSSTDRAFYLRETCENTFNDAAMAITGRLVAVRFVAASEAQAPLATSRFDISRAALNPDYSFEQFVVGPSNRLAHAACRAACSQPGTLYNPLFVHGPSGLGKTHLLQAACAELGKAESNVIYISCETFVNDFVRAIEMGVLQEFRASTRKLSALVLDDVQFLANRESCQEEIFHTFNTLFQARHQIILSADCSPTEIPTLEDRLVSRFNWGLVSQIDPPNRETRQAILQKKARLRGMEVPDEVLDFIAERVEANVRLLEGALTKLVSEAQLAGRPLTVETARESLTGYNGVAGRNVNVRDILDVVSRHYSVRVADLLGRKRSRSVSHPRQVGMYLARRLTPLSLEEIGSHFGGRDHSTVLHAERVVDLDRQQQPILSETLTHLTRELLKKR